MQGSMQMARYQGRGGHQKGVPQSQQASERAEHLVPLRISLIARLKLSNLTVLEIGPLSLIKVKRVFILCLLCRIAKIIKITQLLDKAFNTIISHIYMR